MSGRFFQKPGDSDSDSSSESEEELLSEDESDTGVPSTKPAAASLKSKLTKGAADSDSDDSEEEDEEDESEESGEEAGAGRGRAAFLKGAASDDSESEDDRSEKGVVKSAKDKILDELDSSERKLKNDIKISDWNSVNTEWDKLSKLVQRHFPSSTLPPIPYLEAIVSIEKGIEESGGKKKDMNAQKAKAFTALGNKIKKIARESGDVLKEYKTDPESYVAKRKAADSALAGVPKVVKKADRRATAADDDEAFTEVGKGGKRLVLSTEGIFKALQQVLEARGRKSTDRDEQRRTLEKLLQIAVTPYQKIRIYLALIASLLDYGSAQTSTPTESWAAARDNINALFALLMSERSYVVIEETDDYDETQDRAPSEQEPVIKVRGSLVSLVIRLDDEFAKSLVAIDPHATEYVERLKDEKTVYETVVRAQVYFEEAGLKDPLERVVARRLEHLYYKPDAVIQALENALPNFRGDAPASTSNATPPSSSDLVHQLCTHLYRSESSIVRTRAMLCHAYHYALHDKYHAARDILLMILTFRSQIFWNAEPTTQILYNRAVAQLGLCAFRQGLFENSQMHLHELFQNQRHKELLAQGLTPQRNNPLTPEQEKLERTQQLPFHMHINSDLLESAYLVSSMLVEVPLMAQTNNEVDKRKRNLGRYFRRTLDQTEKQAFVGPPESKKENIVQATKALQAGDWERAVELIHAIKAWSLMPGEKTVKEMLNRKIQEEGLRTYLFTSAPYYSSLSLDHLASTFSVPVDAVNRIVAKMIRSDDIAGTLDQTAGVLVLHKTQATKLQQLALNLADKAEQLTDTNEKFWYTLNGDRENREGGRQDRRDEDGGGRRGGERRRGGGRGGGGRGGMRGGSFGQFGRPLVGGARS